MNYRFSPMPGEFSEILFRLTPAYSWWPPTEAMRQEEEKFELLGRLPAAPGPKFVFAHFLLPHPPWKFNADGSRRLPSVALAASETENYVEQVQYANAQIRKLIDTIARDSARPPIILLAADEGPELRYEGDGELSAEARIRKRSGILLAARLPDRPAAELLPPRSTPVNLFRTVLREYFAAPLPPLDDRAYFWEPANALGKPEWSAAELHDVSEFVWPAETADE